MPYGQSPWMDASDAVGGVGQSMSRVALAQQVGRMNAQRFAAQQALQQAYLQLDRQKQAQAAQLQEARMNQLAAATSLAQSKSQQQTRQTQAGEDLGFDLNQYATASQMQDKDVANSILPLIMQQQGVLAASHPQNIGMQVPQIMESLDPRMRQLIATHTPMMQHVAPEQTLFDVGRGQPVFQGPMSQRPRTGMTPEERRQMAMMRIYASVLSKPGGEAKLPRIMQILEKGQQGGGGSGARPVPKIGETVKGYRFKGGNPAEQSNWEKE